MNAFRQQQELSIKWAELCSAAGFNSSDALLLQMTITTIFGDISLHRSQSVMTAMKIREDFVGETVNKPSLHLLRKTLLPISLGMSAGKRGTVYSDAVMQGMQ